MLRRARIAAAAVACWAGLFGGTLVPAGRPVAAVDLPTPAPAAEPAGPDAPVESPVDAPVDAPADAPVDTPADTPIDAPAEASVLPPDAPLFGEARRAGLAATAIFFSGGDDDSHLDGGAFVLPVPLPWPPGSEGLRSFELDVPAGAPVFVLAAVSPVTRDFLPGTVAVSVDGAPVPSPESFAARGLQLPEADGPQEYAALALVVPPLESGRHTINVACNNCTAAAPNPWLATINAGPRTYVLNVQPPPPPAGAAIVAPFLWRTAAAGDAANGVSAGSPGAPPVGVPLPGLSRSGVVADRLFYSAALDREMPYRVYLPPGYATTGPDGQPATKRYPVLYLLHGLDAGLTQWTNLGLLDELDRLAAAGEVIPFVVVMPSGRTGYWVNHAGGGPRWGDYVAKDLVAHVDATYRTIPQRQARAIGGISMGAHGALQLALNNPDVFGAAGAHSPSLRARTQAPPFLGGFFVNQSGGPGQAAYEARDPISLVRRAAPAPPAAVWIDVGDRDPWAPRARELHTALIERGWAHEWQPAAGSHEDAYWRGRMADYVRFYRQTLLPSFTA